jgi:hypothetical protein
MCETCALAVLWLMNSLPAISRLVIPSASRARTSSSRGVRSDPGSVPLPRGRRRRHTRRVCASRLRRGRPSARGALRLRAIASRRPGSDRRWRPTRVVPAPIAGARREHPRRGGAGELCNQAIQPIEQRVGGRGLLVAQASVSGSARRELGACPDPELVEPRGVEHLLAAGQARERLVDHREPPVQSVRRAPAMHIDRTRVPRPVAGYVTGRSGRLCTQVAA